MNRLYGGVLALLAWVLAADAFALRAAAADVAPEALLPQNSVVYLRYDGLEAHREAYDQTVLARLMREDLGDLVGNLVQMAMDAAGPEVLSERLLAGATPSQLLTLQKAARGIPHVVEFLKNKGVVVGLEVIDPTKPRFQATLVLPGAGKDEKYRSAVYGIVRLGGLLADVELEQSKVEGRTVLSYQEEPGRFACWQEGDHMVVTIGTEDLDHTLALASGKRLNLTANPKFKSLAGFKSYESIGRGLVDFSGIVGVVQKAFPPIGDIVKQLGLADLNSIGFHVGFEGKYQRSTVVLDTTGKRTGLLRLITSAQPVDLKRLPSISPDATSVYTSHLEWGPTFDAVLDAIKVVLKATNPFADPDVVDEGVRGFEKSLGIDLKKDLLDTLGTGIVLSNSPTQGPLTLGTTLAIEVKDAEKLKRSLAIVIKSLAAASGSDVAIKTRKYRGVELQVVYVGEQGFFFLPSYIIHDGWLTVALFPQPVMASVMRSESGYASWKPPALMDEVLADVQKAEGKGAKITTVAMVDPRPGLDTILSIAPVFAAAVQSFSGSSDAFDVSLIPNPKSISELIGPTVAVGVDDGRTVRFESYSTFPLPIEASGVEVYLFVFGFYAFASAF